MSNFLAIATVTATLSNVLQAAISSDVSGATVTTVRPDSQPAGAKPPTVNIYLYQVTPDGAYRNADLPTRRSDGTQVQRAQAALDLHYLMSFYGDDTQYEPQRLLGSVVRTLHERPVLSRQEIGQTVLHPPFNDPTHPSNLADQIELVRFTPLGLSLEEMSKIWSVFFQVPYALSVAYQASVVLIEGQDTPQQALPVLTRNVHVTTFRQPFIDQVVSQAGPDQLIVAGGTLLILGQQLGGEGILVRVAGQDVVPGSITDTQITLPVPAAAQAGVQGLQVVQVLPPLSNPTVESNVAAFVLRPTITPTGHSATQITLSVNPTVRAGQRMVLLLNQTSGAPPAAYTFVPPLPAADTASLVIPISGVTPGTYFVRLQVDGAESPVDLDPHSATFGPTVTIP